METIVHAVNSLNRLGARLRVEKAARNADQGSLILVGRDPIGQPVNVQGDQEAILTELNCIAA